MQEYRIDQQMPILGDIKSALLAAIGCYLRGQETAEEQLTFVSE